MATHHHNVVAVFGSCDPVEGGAEYEFARQVGHKLAELGYVVATGGYGGAMEAACRGAKEAGGTTVGVLCSIWNAQPNAFVDRRIETCSMEARLAAFVELGRCGYVVLGGATGTLVELATMWEMMCKKLMARRPLVCAGFWSPLVEMMSRARAGCEQFVACIERPQDLSLYFAPRERL